VPADQFERYNGWLLLAHPELEDQLSKLTTDVVRLQTRDPSGYQSSSKAKRLATLEKLIFEVIPSNPEAKLWLLGNSLGKTNRAWRRAVFLQQYRLFFRFDSRAKILVYGWVNDERTLRAYGSRTDAYAVFASRLESGNPPSEWDELLEQAQPLRKQNGKQPNS
jgi:toxin YhaV